jgi:hypothetical protein
MIGLKPIEVLNDHQLKTWRCPMASAILNKEDRLTYIKEAALRMKEEKRRDFIIAQTETEFADTCSVETDVTMIDEFCGMVSTGIAKVRGGLRHMPVIIL